MDLGTNNNNKQQLRTFTRGPQFYNAESILFPSTLVVGGWDRMISLKVHPAKDKSMQTTSSVYDYEKAIQTAITPQQALDLYHIIMEKIIPSLSAETPEKIQIGIPIAGVNMVLISNGVNKGCNPYLAIYKNINQDFVPEQKIYYEFNTSDRIYDYDECKSVEMRKEVGVTELEYFALVLYKFASALSGAEYHSMMEYNKFIKAKEIQKTNAIASALGVELPSGNGQRNYRQKDDGPNWGDTQSEDIGGKISQVDNLESFI